MFVAIVTAPFLPACAMISPSFSASSGFAFKRLCFTPATFRYCDNNSFFSIEIVPTSTGCPFWFNSFIFLAMALNFPSSVMKIRSLWSFLAIGLCVGTATTSSPYTFTNSSRDVKPVPVIPASLSYSLNRFWYVIEAAVLLSLWIFTPSLASIAWWIPSDHLRPGWTLPVDVSTIRTSLSFTK